VIAAAIMLNAVVSGTKLRDKLKIDLTSNKLYSIGEKTSEVLKELDTDVEIIGLFDEKSMESTQYGQVIEFIKQYENKSSKIKIKYVDPAKNPAYIQNELDPTGVLGISNYDFVVRSGKRVKVLSSSDIFEYTFDSQTYSGYYLTGLNAEYAFTGAIRYVTTENVPVIYFTEGHGEGDPEKDFSDLKSNLELNGYEVKKINLAAVESVPEDASLIIFANPLQDLKVDELDKLTTFSENGGSTVFLFDPPQTAANLTYFEEFLSEYNVTLGYDVIFEMAENRSYFGQPYYFIPTVEDNTINELLDPDKLTISLFNARSIDILINEKEWIKPYTLLSTSSEAVGKALKEGNEDKQGPLKIGVAVEHTGRINKSWAIVIGNANFVADETADTTGNGKKLLINGINKILDKDSDVYIPVKKYSTPRIQTITNQTIVILGIVLIIVVPLFIIGIGVFVWLRRRHL
ncbi:MAG TPA: GldG family protein, partial [Clostridia bacterium]